MTSERLNLPTTALLRRVVAVMCIVCFSAHAALSGRTNQWEVTDRGTNYTLWQRATWRTNFQSGLAFVHTNSIVELGANLNLSRPGGWVRSNPEFQITADGAEATNAFHKLFVPGDIASDLPISVTAAGQKISFRPLGIDYFDPTTGDAALLDIVVNAGGWLVSSNTVVYSNCFAQLKASIRVVNTPGGVECDLILHERPPEPALFGFSSLARIEMLTEHVDGADPAITYRVVSEQDDPATGVAVFETDTQLQFGGMSMVTGQAFGTSTDGTNALATASPAQVGKSYEVIGGRRVLIEGVNYRKLLPALDQLPEGWTNVSVRSTNYLQLVSDQRQLPPRKAAAIRSPVRKSDMLAMNVSPGVPEVVIDYQLVSGSGVNNFTFQKGVTYVVNGYTHCAGTTTIEGGAVIKYVSGATLFFAATDSIDWKTDLYNPAMFTSDDDVTIGETFALPIGSSGAYVHWYTWPLTFAGGTRELHDFRVSFLHGVLRGEGATLTVRNVQAYSTHEVFLLNGSCRLNLLNGLATAFTRFAAGDSVQLNLQHVTAHSTYGSFAQISQPTSSTAALTNCLFVQVPTGSGQFSSWNAASSPFVASSAGMFTGAGGGLYYLANGSYRDIGATMIDPLLNWDFARMTTVAPLPATGSSVMPRRVIRDTSKPDLGYHYAVVDYLYSSATPFNVQIGAGVVLALSADGTNAFGSVTSQGTAVGQNTIVLSSRVQETPLYNAWDGTMIRAGGCTATFTEFALTPPGGNAWSFFDPSGYYDEVQGGVDLRHCRLSDAALVLYSMSYSGNGAVFVNNILRNTYIALDRQQYDYCNECSLGGDGDPEYYSGPLYSPMTVMVLNNLMQNTSLYYYNDRDPFSWWNTDIHNNLVDGGNLYAPYDDETSVSHNAYTGLGPPQTDSGGNITGLFLDFKAFPLGDFYCPRTGGQLSRLINAGDRSALSVGLENFTADVSLLSENQEVSGDTTVDIGYHFPVVRPAVLNVSEVPLAYDAGAGVQLLDGTLTLEDPDGEFLGISEGTVLRAPLSTGFAQSFVCEPYLTMPSWRRRFTGAVRVGFVPGTSDDILGIKSGNGPTEVHVNGSEILVGDERVAFFVNYPFSSDTATLIIYFNARVPKSTIQTVLRNVTYSRHNGAPDFQSTTIVPYICDSDNMFSWAERAITIVGKTLRVSLISPGAAQHFGANTPTIALQAHVAGAQAAIRGIEFFADNTRLGVATLPMQAGGSDYAISWHPTLAGPHAISARVTDVQGGSAECAPVTISINYPPSVIITHPANSVIYQSGIANIGITATAADSDGLIAKVQFYHDAVLIGEDTTAPFSTTWNGVAPGRYVLTAVATDNEGATQTSRAVAVTVRSANAAPTVNAGPDTPQIVRVGVPVSLNGIVTDDGLPLPTTLAVQWRKLSGPEAAVSFADANKAVTTATFSENGIFTLELSGSDGAFQSVDTIRFDVRSANLPPQVSAGTDSTLLLPAANLNSIVPSQSDHADVIDTKGKYFWLCIPRANDFLAELQAEELSLIITATKASSVLVEIPGLPTPFSQTFSLHAGEQSQVLLPYGAMLRARDARASLGIRVTATEEVSVYGITHVLHSTDGFAALPVDALGKEYIVVAYPNVNLNGSLLAIVATENGTTVTLTPSAGSGLSPITINGMNAGETYQTWSASSPPADVTGTRVIADKPVAVFGGHVYTRIPTSASLAANHLVEQMTPTSTWGREYFTVPLATRTAGDVIRIVAAQDSTSVQINGTAIPITLNAGQVYQVVRTTSSHITANKPICVGQYSQSKLVDSSTAVADPFFMLVAPSSGFLESYNIGMHPTAFTRLFVNVICPNSGIGAISLDGSLIPASAFAAIGTSTYSGAAVEVNRGPHSLKATVPFGVSVYGYAPTDGFGYPAGMLLGSVGVLNQIVLSPHLSEKQVSEVIAFTATALAADNTPLPSIRITFQVIGTHTLSKTVLTDAEGNARFSYRGVQPGIDNISISSGGLSDSGSLSWTSSYQPLDGLATDDGLPGPLATVWSAVEPPAPLVLRNQNQVHAQADISVPGVYVFSLTANDSEYQVADSRVVTVRQNQAPTVNAGIEQNISTRTTKLRGFASDDGATSSALAVLWTKVSGPGNVVFANPTRPETDVTVDGLGTYILRLSADDSLASSYDEMTLVVAPAHVEALVCGHISGTLNSNDAEAVNRGGSFVDYYSFSGQAGDRVSFAMSSPSFDSYLYLLSPSLNIVAANDDFYSTHAQLSYQLRETGTYLVACTSKMLGATGAYALDCGSGKTILNCGMTIRDQETREGDLPSTAPGGFGFYFADFYKIYGMAGDGKIAIVLYNNYGGGYAKIIVRNVAGQIIASADCDDVNPTISMTLPQTGFYDVEVALNDGFANYELTYSCDVGANAAEVAVSSNGSNVPHNGAVNYGSTRAGTPLLRSFTIANQGNRDLLIGTVSATGDFSVGSQPAALVLPGATTPFTVKFNATSVGGASGTVSFSNNDGNNGDGFENPFVINLSGTATTPNPSVVAVTGPAAGSVLPAGPIDIDVTASANDSDGIQRVDFYCDGTFIGSDSTAPYSILWKKVQSGSFSLTARAVDQLGEVVESTPVAITVGSSTVTLASSQCPNILGAQQTVLATLVNNVGAALSGVMVTFNVSGANARTGNAVTGTDGKASFTYPGANAGVDQVQASAIVNAQSIQSVPASFGWPSLVECGATRAGTLASGDAASLSIPGSAADYYQLTGARGQTVTITLDSTDLDPVLFLWDSDCHVVAQNDDSRGGLNSRVIYTLPKDGIYLIEATRFQRAQSGDYSLELSCGYFAAGPEISVFADGQAITDGGSIQLSPTPYGTPISKVITIKNQGAAPLALSSLNLSVGGSLFDVPSLPASPLAPGETTTFTLRFTPPATPGTYSTVISIVNNDTDNGDGVESPFEITVNARALAAGTVVNDPNLTLTPLKACPSVPGTTHTFEATLRDYIDTPLVGANVVFEIVGPHQRTQTVTTDANGKATFTLTGASPGYDKARATATVNGRQVASEWATRDWSKLLQPFDKVAGSLDTTDGFSQGCNCVNPDRYADYYHFTGEAGQTVTITLKSGEFDTYMFLRKPYPTCTILTQNDDENPESSDSQIVFVLPETGTYIVEATSFDPWATGDYTIHLNWGRPDENPELEVVLDGVVLTNYGTLNFGIQTAGTIVNKTLTIRNRGTGPLNLRNLSHSGSGNFTFENPPPTTPVFPNSSTELQLRFIAASAGTYSGALRLDNDDGDNGDGVESPFILNFAAIANPSGTPPVGALSSPVTAATFRLPATIIIAGGATASGATINRLEFYVNDLLIANVSALASHQFNWPGAFPGKHALTLRATDSAGRVSVSAPVTITVTQDPNNHPPVAVNDTHAVGENAEGVINVLANDSDADNDLLRVVSVTAAESGEVKIINDGRAIRYLPYEYILGTDGFSYTISDGRGGTATAKVAVSINEVPLPNVTLLTPATGSRPNAGSPVSLSVSAAAGLTVSYYVDNTKVGEVASSPPYAFNWTAREGEHFIYARARNLYGQQAQSAAVIVTGIPNANDPAPVAQINNLAGDTSLGANQPLPATPILRQPTFVVQGLAYDPNDAGSYQVRVYRPDGTLVGDFTPEPKDAEGFCTVEVNPAGKLATLDLSRLLNRVYELELVVRGGGRETRASVPFALECEVKIGQFTFSQEDLAIPLYNSASLSVVRTYNTLNPTRGDFGYGWTYSMNDLEVVLGEYRQTFRDAFDENDSPFSMRVGGSRDVTLTLPDGRRTTFRFYLEPCEGDSGEFGLCYQAKWAAAPGVTAKLDVLGGQNTVESYLDDFFWHADAMAPFENYDLPGFVLTAEDGTRYIIKRDTDQQLHGVEVSPGAYVVLADVYGTPRLAKVIPATGGEITVNDNGAVFTKGGATVNSITFQRTRGLITGIVDAMGQSFTPVRPVVTYEYDDKDNLIKVSHLVDRTAGTYETTTFTYGRAEPQLAHYITAINDPRGVTAVRPTYDVEGRLTALTDAQGRTQEFVHSLFERTETVVDSSGNATIHSYDERGNIVATKDAKGNVTFYEYDDHNRVTREISPSGVVTRFEYTPATSAQPVSMKETIYPTDGRPPIVRLEEYTAQGNVKTSIEPRFYVSSGTPSFYKTFEYDSAGNQAKTIGHWAGGVTRVLSEEVYYPNNADGTVDASVSPELSGLLRYSIDGMGNRTLHTYYQSSDTDIANGRSGYEKEIIQQQRNPDGSFKDLSRTLCKYDANGNRTHEINKKFNATLNQWHDYADTEHRYDAQNRVTETIDPLGGHATLQFDGSGNLIARTDRYGATTRFTFDASREIVQTEYPNGAIARNVTYYASNPALSAKQVKHVVREKPHFIGEPVMATRTVFDELNRVVQSEQLTDVVIDLVPDQLLQKSVFRRGTQAVVSKTRYDALGRVSMTSDMSGKWTAYEYDDLGNQWKIRKFVKADGAEIPGVTVTTLSGFDAAGNVQWTLDANQCALLMNQNGGLLAGTAWSVHQALYGDPTPSAQRHRLTHHEYDELNREVVEHKPSDDVAVSVTTTANYDIEGRKWLEVDEDGHGTAYFYDAAGRLQWVITDVNPAATYPSPVPADFFQQTWAARQADSTVTRYAYDEFGNLVQQTDANQRVTEFQYDAMNRRTQRKLPGQVRRPNGDLMDAVETWSYDYSSQGASKSNQVRRRDLNGRFSLTMSDAMGRVTSRKPDGKDSWADPLPSGGGQQVTFTYTAGGQRAKMSDASGDTRYAYDERGRVRVAQSSRGTLCYGYDDEGQLNEISARRFFNFTSPTDTQFVPEKVGSVTDRPTGAHMSYEYNGANRLSAVYGAPNEMTPRAAYQYLSAGELQSVTYANGVVTGFDYDARSHLRRVRSVNSGGLIANFDYDETGEDAIALTSRNTWGASLLKPSGRRNRVSERISSNLRTVNYAYDALNRLGSESVSGSSITYDNASGHASPGYDPVGNRRSRTVSGAGFPGVTTQTANSYDANDRLDNDADPVSPSTSYDANGNLIASGPWTYAYDFENHLISAMKAGTAITFVYDGDGRRAQKIINGSSTFYLVDDQNPTGFAQVLEELSTSGNPSSVYTYGMRLITQERGGSLSYYGFDGLGSVRYLSDDNGAVTDTCTYDAFGITMGQTFNTPNVYRFSGEQWDNDIDAYYLRARYFKPENGLFMSGDPFEGVLNDPWSLHRYVYCANNPVNTTDPSGEMTYSEVTLVATVGVGVGVGVYLVMNSDAIKRMRTAGKLVKSSRVASEQELRWLGKGFRLMGSDQVSRAQDAIEDGTVTVYIVTNSTMKHGAHVGILRGRVFVPQNQLRDPAKAAFFAFGEFQHDTMGNNQTEKEAQKEVNRIIKTLPAPYNGWTFEHGK
jgi:RHS repeat-associated protein